MTTPHIAIVHEDNHTLVVVKPFNVPSQEDASGSPDMLTLLKQDLKQRYNKPGNVYLGLVHRLDRPAGGLMVFAKTSKAASRLSDQMRTRKLDKRYFAVVHGHPRPAAGTLRHWLLKDAASNTSAIVSADTAGAKQAVLEYETLGVNGGLALVGVRLHTGRPHQIRAQLAAAGCPLYGDQKYGAAVNKPGQQLALWSALLGFEHPTSREPLQFACAPPDVYPWQLWPNKPTGGEAR